VVASTRAQARTGRGRAVDAQLPAGAVTFDCPAGEAGPSANMSGPRLDASQLPPAAAVVQCA
jgi:hypothetical protein